MTPRVAESRRSPRVRRWAPLRGVNKPRAVVSKFLRCVVFTFTAKVALFVFDDTRLNPLFLLKAGVESFPRGQSLILLAGREV